MLVPDADLRLLLLHGLSRAGYAPVEYEGWDGRAVEAVLVEPACPEAGEVVDEARTDDAIPVVCISIYEPDGRLTPPGTSAYLLKPFRMSEIVETLDRLAYAGTR